MKLPQKSEIGDGCGVMSGVPNNGFLEILLAPSPHNISQNSNFLKYFYKKVDSTLKNGSVKFRKWS
jgi:hypothetical protein